MMWSSRRKLRTTLQPAVSVVGHGLLIPVVSEQEATQLLAGLQGKKKPVQLSVVRPLLPDEDRAKKS